MEVDTDALLMLKVSGLNIVGSNGRGLGVGVVLVHGGEGKEWAWTDRVLASLVFGAAVPVVVESDEVESA